MNENSQGTKIAVMQNDISQIKQDIGEIKTLIKDMDNKYISRAEFKFYQVVLGLIGSAVLLYVVNVFLTEVFHK